MIAFRFLCLLARYSPYDFGHVLILNRLQIIPAFFFKQFDKKEVNILTFFKEVLISIIFN
jgi:hypothetical protein